MRGARRFHTRRRGLDGTSSGSPADGDGGGGDGRGGALRARAGRGRREGRREGPHDLAVQAGAGERRVRRRPGDHAELSPTGVPGAASTPRRAQPRKLDCFYVYPTVSNQPTPAATKAIDPEVRSIALYQAARYSQLCKVYAPVYRQITLSIGLGSSAGAVTPKMRATAYNDVRDAFRTYLRKYNNGRGVRPHRPLAGRLRAAPARGPGGRPKAARPQAARVGDPARRQRPREEGLRPRRGLPQRPRVPLARSSCTASWRSRRSARRRRRTPRSAGRRASSTPARRAPRARGRVHEPRRARAAARPRSRRSSRARRSRPGRRSAGRPSRSGSRPRRSPRPGSRPTAPTRASCVSANGATSLQITPRGGAPKLHPAARRRRGGCTSTDANIALGDLVDARAQAGRAVRQARLVRPRRAAAGARAPAAGAAAGRGRRAGSRAPPVRPRLQRTCSPWCRTVSASPSTSS